METVSIPSPARNTLLKQGVNGIDPASRTPAARSPALIGPPAARSPALIGPPAARSPTLIGPPTARSPALIGPPAARSPALIGPLTTPSPALINTAASARCVGPPEALWNRFQRFLFLRRPLAQPNTHSCLCIPTLGSGYTSPGALWSAGRCSPATPR